MTRYRRKFPCSHLYAFPRHRILEAIWLQIREALQSFRNTGDTDADADVREYFFSLTYRELLPILVDYREKYGGDAEANARKMRPKWRALSVEMPGHVERRLFDLLPRRMSTRKKHELAGNVWRRFGPKSQLLRTIGPDTDAKEIATRVAATLDRVENKFKIPGNVKNRINWLESGDVRRARDFLRFFRQSRRDLAVARVKAAVPILQRKYADERKYADDLVASRRPRTVVRIDGHVIVIWYKQDKPVSSPLR